MTQLQNLPVDRLFQHPHNPRKDLGDLTELTESIRANGILQNLTVVKHYGEVTKQWYEEWSGYDVIIGHRRLAAAKLAGLETVPCVVVELTPREQLQTMLMENMQRSDLTVYEQAQGFQMMLDLGDSVSRIAESTGFSESTVRRRVKLLSLDPERFKASEARGATLADYAELEKLEDPILKNKVLDTIGTENFRNALKKALDDENKKKMIAGFVAVAETFAERIAGKGAVGNNLARAASYYYWDKDKAMEVPEDADTTKYYFCEDDVSVTIYREKSAGDADSAAAENDHQNREARERSKRIEHGLDEVTERHYLMRVEFVQGVTSSEAKHHLPEIAAFAGENILGFSGYYGRGDVDMELLSQLLDFDIDGERFNPDEFETLYQAAFARAPEYGLLAVAYAATDRDNLGFWRRQWNQGTCEFPHYENEKLKALYDFLTSIGYDMSNEEESMRDGTHELLQSEEDADNE